MSLFSWSLNLFEGPDGVSCRTTSLFPCEMGSVIESVTSLFTLPLTVFLRFSLLSVLLSFLLVEERNVHRPTHLIYFISPIILLLFSCASFLEATHTEYELNGIGLHIDMLCCLLTCAVAC